MPAITLTTGSRAADRDQREEHITALGRRQARRIAWRIGSKQQQGQPAVVSGRFVFCRLRQANAGTRASTLPATTRRADLVRAAKQRWRIECPTDTGAGPMIVWSGRVGGRAAGE